jgi:hypothetical protein
MKQPTKPAKPELFRPSSPSNPVGNNTQIKQSLLAGVDALRIDKGKKGGGV